MKLKNLISIIEETLKLRSKRATWSSCIVYLFSHLFARVPSVRRLVDSPMKIVFTDGVIIYFRCNLGDLQSIREVWIEEHYQLPHGFSGSNTLVDLGANIGLTSLWLMKRYGFKQIVAVEPEQSNIEILRLNFSVNNVPAKLLAAAIGPSDGEAYFEVSSSSNMGRLGTSGVPTKLLSMKSVLNYLPTNSMIDLLKIDIEGGEESLFSANLDWLDRVHTIVAELHPLICDTAKVIQTIRSRSFVFSAGGTAGRDNFKMDTFVRLADTKPVSSLH